MSFERVYKQLFTIIFLLCGILITEIHPESVFIKDGSIVDGTIVSEKAGTVILKMPDKKQVQIPRKEILRILYTKINMSKVYVQMTNGKNFTGYMVDEDRDSYIFRKELYKPEEFTVKREDVLFMSRGNPSGLKGNPGTDKIELSWTAPFNEIKNYNIYFKEEKDDKYTKIDECIKNTCIVKNLKSRKRYMAYVTAVDASGAESIPSNELSFSTKSVKPYEPADISSERIVEESGRYSIKLKWSEAASPDGKISGYNIYRYVDMKPVLVDKTANTEYRITGLTDKICRLGVKSLDDLNEESEKDAYITVMEKYLPAIELNANYILPQGNLGKIYKYGYGGTISLFMDRMFTNHLDMGITGGYWNFKGNTEDINSGYIAPFTFTIRYNIPFFRMFYFTPTIDSGGCYNYICYKTFDMSQETTCSKKSLDWIVEAGGNIVLEPGDNIRICAGSSYGIIFEKSSQEKLIALRCGIEYKF